MSPKEISNKLINLPRPHRVWLVNNVAPDTLVRWMKQGNVALKPYKNFQEKIKAIVSGEELSECAKFEKRMWDKEKEEKT